MCPPPDYPHVISLFTGGGGLDIGFHRAGFCVLACVEINSDFCKTLELNKPKYFASDCQIINKDIREFDPREVKIAQCDFIIGGPPCQSFSAAGRRAGGIMGINDSRGSLFEHYCRLIKYYKPKGFLFENVRGILSANQQNDWNGILSVFSALGYQISFRILDAADYGVPQHRERLILVGTKKGCDFLFPAPTYGPDSPSKRPHISCRQAIADLQDSNEQDNEYGGKYGRLLKEVPPGLNYHHFTRELGHPNPIFAWRSRFSDFLYKAHPDYPVRTVVARLGAFSGPFHWKNRRFTVEEYKRLFSFPDDYQLAGPLNTMLQQLGNSVPPAFAEQLALAVLKQVFDIDVAVELIEPGRKLSFDRRKGEKARKTRRNRLSSEMADLPLFAHVNQALIPDDIISETYYCSYPTWRQVVRRRAISESSESLLIEIQEHRQGTDAHLIVSRSYNGNCTKRPLLEYELKFHRMIGDGLKMIKCELRSDNDVDVVAAWDAIEHYINKHSNYLSLMDVYGHFTEPHPIFDLKLRICRKHQSPLLRFAQYFSDFSKLGVEWPASLLESFQNKNEEFSFIGTVKWLRSLRFDVRVFETNPTIRPGFFRCCYPFTLHVDKQVSVSWKDDIKGNSVPALIK